MERYDIEIMLNYIEKVIENHEEAWTDKNKIKILTNANYLFTVKNILTAELRKGE